MIRAFFCFSICFTFLFIQNIVGQNDRNNNDDSLPDDTLNFLTRNGNESLQIYSPEIYALARYGDVPVDYSSGVPAISIPLMSISDRDISVDISLSYHATGIKVDQEATWVGLGWALNAGGIIAREVRGMKDDNIYGNFTYRPFIPDYDYSKPVKQYIQEIQSALDNLSSEHYNYDGEPDVFYYNFCGKVGKFVLDQNAKACFFKYEDFRVEFTVPNKFIIIDNFGVKYEFNNNINSVYSENEWYLMKMTSPSGGEINFTYQNVSMNQWRRMESTCFIEVYPPNSAYHIIDGSGLYHAGWVTNSNSSYNRLVKITTQSGHYINFNPSATQRLDVSLYDASVALDEIILYNNKNEIQKKAKLEYGYFQANNFRKYKNQQNQSPPDFDFLNYRLRLESVKELSSTGITGATYQFEYYGNDNPAVNDTLTLPYRLSPQQDHWGYYNYSNNITIFPNNSAFRAIPPDQWMEWYFYDRTNFLAPFGMGPGTVGISSQVTGGANRDPHSEAVKAGSLKKITYPTGGYTQFVYESHQSAVHFMPGGGIRIKEIESNDGVGNTIVKKYTYEPFWGPTAEYFLNEGQSPYHTLYYNPYNDVTLQSVPQILMAAGVPSSMAWKLKVFVIKIDGASQIQLGGGLEAVYSKVTETITGGGRTEYYYSCRDNALSISPDPDIVVNGVTVNDAFKTSWIQTVDYQWNNASVFIGSIDFRSFPFPKPISNDWRNRLLVNKKTFREDGILIAEDSIFYKVETLHALPNFKVRKFVDNEYMYVRSYTTGGVVKVIREVNQQNIAGQGIIRTVKEYDYNSPSHKQITESRTWNSSNELFTDRYYYPTEYGNTLSFLKDENMLLPVDVRSYKGSKLLSGVQTKYNQQGQVETKYRFDTGVNDIAFNSLNPYTFTPYVWNTYNASDLWQTNLDVSGLSCVYLWSYKCQYPIAKIQNATLVEVNAVMNTVFGVANADALAPLQTPNETKLKDGSLQNALPNALVTTYTYKPLIGISTITDPRGVVTEYNYDSFGRLIKVTEDNKVIEQYDYNYKN